PGRQSRRADRRPAAAGRAGRRRTRRRPASPLCGYNGRRLRNPLPHPAVTASLRILFVEPPPERRVGGIETALAGWSDALRAAGLDVVRADAPDDAELRAADVVHFHGLWERGHPALRARCDALGKPWLCSPHGMLEPWAFAHKRWKKLPYFHL